MSNSGIVESGSSGSAQQGVGKGTSRMQLVQRLMAATAPLPEFLNDLLTTQAVVVAGTEAAAFIIERAPAAGEQKAGEAEFSLRPIAHIRPDEATAETRAAAINAFMEMIRPCVTQNKDGAVSVGSPDPTGENQFCLITLLRSEGNLVAVSAVITRCLDLDRAKQRLTMMQLVAGYFDSYTLRRSTEQTRIVAQSHQNVLQLSSAVATSEGFDGAAANLCNELATRTGATRVALGWVVGRGVKVKALSHTEKFDRKQEIVTLIQRSMEECLDQEEAVRFEPGGQNSANVTRAAADLSRANAGVTVLSLPLRRAEEVVGVVTLEFGQGTKVTETASTGLAVAVDLLAPQLYDRYQNDRWLITKAGLSAKHAAGLAIGPRHMLAKLVIALLIGAGFTLWLYRPMYRVKAPFTFAAAEKVTLVVPFEAKIKEVKVRSGQSVRAGEVLLVLDTSDLADRRDAALKLAAAARAREQDARFAREPRIAEADAEAKTAESEEFNASVLSRQIESGTIRAPAAKPGEDPNKPIGDVLKGEWNDKVGSQVQQGTVLFEIARRGDLKAELLVDERDIEEFADNGRTYTGRLATTSNPNDRFGITVTRIIPLGETKDASNVFRVEARLDERAEHWRPGMEGEARLDIEPRSLGWQWTHRVVQYVRLKLWL